jgi:MFS family permease
MRERSNATVVAGIALGFATTWNVTSVGAAADPLADAYGVSLPAIGLLTTALFVTHLAAQLPAGYLSDRHGARRVGLAALAATALGNGLALLADVFALGVVARLITGLGTGSGFVAGLDLVRAGGGGPTTQGLYGGGTMAGGGLAIAVVPLLDGLGWRAPFWTGWCSRSPASFRCSSRSTRPPRGRTQSARTSSATGVCCPSGRSRRRRSGSASSPGTGW